MTATREAPAPTPSPAPAHEARGVAFAALRNSDYRSYWISNVLFMTADNIEHVVSYFVLFYVFQSPVLAGYAVIGHWMPSLLFSVYAGSLADRFDCRKLIQISLALFIGCSLAWGVLIATDTLEMWMAVAILTIHGVAVVIRGPAQQIIIHDIVGSSQLPSAVRLMATGIQVGLVIGPALGGAAMLWFGAATCMLLNALLYLPQIIWSLRVPYTGHLSEASRARPVRVGVEDLARVVREVSGNRAILAMVVLVGATSLFIGSGIQSQMPEFARDLGENGAGLQYTILQMAAAVGAILGGVVLEGGNLLRPSVRAAIICAAVFGLIVVAFAATPVYAVAVVLLFFLGAFRLAFGSMAQALVQLLAPAHLRGRIIGVFVMAQSGLQTGSGATIGLLGAVVGVHWSLGLSGLAVFVATVWLFLYTRSAASRPVAAA
jgi:MFS family permease